jgi:spermidine synthase
MEKIIKTILLGTVFITGACVLVIEVAAIRMLAPYFGSSLYVLSSVLTVVLFALALGYYFGGKLSDRYPYHLPLYLIITFGGLTVLSITLMAGYLLPATNVLMPLLFGPLIYSIAFFFLPAFLLGIDSPFVIKLLSLHNSSEASGEIVGATFFWSTAGSISGSLLSGFYLIPTLGLTLTMTTIGTLLVMLGIGGAVVIRALLKKDSSYDTRNDISLQPLYFFSLIFVICALYFTFTNQTYAKSLYARDGYYAHIHIFDGEYNGQPTRFLKQDTNNSSAIYLDRDDLVYAYAQFSNVYEDLFPNPTSFLMLAGGAYTIPRAIHQSLPDVDIDVVEIEPDLFSLAHQYFRLPQTDKITNHVLDSRAFLARTDKTYDYIFVDTFSSGHFVPPHLVTAEFFTLLKERLSPDGIVVMNFIASRPSPTKRTLVGSFTKTVAQVFPNFSVHTMRLEFPDQPQNLLYIMRNGDKPLTLSPDRSVLIQNQAVALRTLEIDPTSLISADDIIFTDDHAPVETLLFKERFKF